MRDITEPPVPVYLVWSHEHGAWWRPNSCGYTGDVWQAGRYSERDAARICAGHRRLFNGSPYEVMVPAPENDQPAFTPDDLRGMPDRMTAAIETATREALDARARREASEQGGEVFTR